MDDIDLIVYAMDEQEIVCPECGSSNIDVYDDGTCICQDCQYEFDKTY